MKLRCDALVVRDGRILTAGAVNAHFNLALDLVAEVAGPDLALLCAKSLLVDLNRTSQLPYAVLPTHTGHADAVVLGAQQWMREHLGEGFGLPEVARAQHVSTRTLARRFHTALGTTPLVWLQRVRVETAKHLLESTGLALARVADRVGYEDVSAFRRVFRREAGVSPREYRRRFRYRE